MYPLVEIPELAQQATNPLRGLREVLRVNSSYCLWLLTRFQRSPIYISTMYLDNSHDSRGAVALRS